MEENSQISGEFDLPVRPHIPIKTEPSVVSEIKPEVVFETKKEDGEKVLLAKYGITSNPRESITEFLDDVEYQIMLLRDEIEDTNDTDTMAELQSDIDRLDAIKIREFEIFRNNSSQKAA